MHTVARRVAVPLGEGTHVRERIEREPQRVVGGPAIVRQRAPQHRLGIVAAEVPEVLAIAPGDRPIEVQVGATD
jgi:hypothetical protein